MAWAEEGGKRGAGMEAMRREGERDRVSCGSDMLDPSPAERKDKMLDKIVSTWNQVSKLEHFYAEPERHPERCKPGFNEMIRLK